jgi:hypothetical protein
VKDFTRISAVPGNACNLTSGDRLKPLVKVVTVRSLVVSSAVFDGDRLRINLLFLTALGIIN